MTSHTFKEKNVICRIYCQNAGEGVKFPEVVTWEGSNFRDESSAQDAQDDPQFFFK